MVSCKVTVEGEFWSEKMEDEGFSELLFSKTVGIPTLGIVRWEMVRKPLNLWGETQMILSQFLLSFTRIVKLRPGSALLQSRSIAERSPRSYLGPWMLFGLTSPSLNPHKGSLKLKRVIEIIHVNYGAAWSPPGRIPMRKSRSTTLSWLSKVPMSFLAAIYRSLVFQR